MIAQVYWSQCRCCGCTPHIQHNPRSTIVGCECEGCPGNLGPDRKIVGPGPMSYDIQTGMTMGDRCYAEAAKEWNQFTERHAAWITVFCDFTSNSGIQLNH